MLNSTTLRRHEENNVTIQTSDDPTAFNEFEQRGWETSSAGYERHFTRITRQTVPSTLDAAGVTQGTRTLDVCTGPGMLVEVAMQRGAMAVGLDFSSEAVEIARRNVPGAEFRQGDAQALPFDDASFDAVVCGYGIIHVPDPEKALEEMHRVLRPGGRVAVSVWQAPKPTNGFGVLFGAIKRHGNLDVPLPHGPDFFQFSGTETMTATLEAMSFRGVTAQHVEQTWDIDKATGLVHAILEGTVRARAMLLAQTVTARTAIEAAVEEGIARYRVAGGGFRVPMPALVGAGTK